jgi:hypothetical protein
MRNRKRGKVKKGKKYRKTEKDIEIRRWGKMFEIGISNIFIATEKKIIFFII